MKSAWLAGLLSFIAPGLGQIYVGQIIIGLLLIVLYMFTILFSSSIFGRSFTLIGMILLPIVWLLAIAQAVVTAIEVNRNFTPEN